MNKEKYQPDLLYHYTKAKTLLDNIFQNRTLQFNLLSKTNDPLEYHTPQSVSLSSTGLDSKGVLHHQYEEIIQKEKSYIRLACFCQDDEEKINNNSINPQYEKGYGKPRVWAQYGDSHQGVCIVFSKEKLLEKLKIIDPKLIKKEIEYTNDNLYLKNVENFDPSRVKNTVRQYFQQEKESDFEKMLFHKYKDYRDESEYRIILRQEDGDPLYIDISGCIKAVIIGDKCCEKKSKIIKKKCDKKNILTCGIIWHGKGPDLISSDNSFDA